MEWWAPKLLFARDPCQCLNVEQREFKSCKVKYWFCFVLLHKHSPCEYVNILNSNHHKMSGQVFLTCHSSKKTLCEIAYEM